MSIFLKCMPKKCEKILFSSEEVFKSGIKNRINPKVNRKQRKKQEFITFVSLWLKLLFLTKI